MHLSKPIMPGPVCRLHELCTVLSHSYKDW